MLQPELTQRLQDLQQILDLQSKNLSAHLQPAEIQSEGFVTLHHSPEVLKQMHELAPSVIIKDNEKVIAYALTMRRECRLLIPDLEPMFVVLDGLSWKNKPLNDYRFYIMGQVCVAREYRGKGLVEKLYNYHRDIYSGNFDLMVTEIATRNHRSLRAHEKAGFKIIHTHRDELDEWVVVAWDWR